MRLEFNIPLYYLTEDFIDTIVNNHLATRGDDLYYSIKTKYRSNCKRFDDIFTHKYFYIVRDIKNNNVIFQVA